MYETQTAVAETQQWLLNGETDTVYNTLVSKRTNRLLPELPSLSPGELWNHRKLPCSPKCANRHFLGWPCNNNRLLLTHVWQTEEQNLNTATPVSGQGH